MLAYTSIGTRVMVALRPQLLPTAKVEMYVEGTTSALPPHPFSLCEFAYRSMDLLRRDQSIFIRGDKSSGKSVVFNEILHFFKQRCDISKGRESIKADWLAGLPASQVLLDSFCGVHDALAANSCSSRYGQLLTLKFRDVSSDSVHADGMALCAAKVVLFAPVDRARLVSAGSSRHFGSFDIFHQVIAAAKASEHLQGSLMLKKGDVYKLANPAVSPPQSDDSYAKKFDSTLDALHAIRLSRDAKDEVLAILAAMLHLGNIDYPRSGAEPFESQALRKQFSFITAAALLRVPASALEAYLTDASTAVGSRVVPAVFSHENAIVSRGALLAALYDTLLGSILSAVNAFTKANTIGDGASAKLPQGVLAQTSRYIHVVHASSPDPVDCSSIDSLFYNHSCELLHSWHIRDVLLAEQLLCEALQVPGGALSFAHGGDALSLVAGSPLSVLSLLQIASQQDFPSDAHFFEELHGSLEGSAAFSAINNADKRSSFCVRHYFGDVSYQSEYGASLWISLNRDGCDASLDTLYSSSDLVTLRSAVTASKQQTTRVSGGAKKATRAAVFLEALASLESCVANTERYSILCIRCSANGAATLDKSLVLAQISTLMIPQAVHALRLNMPMAIPFTEFKASLSGLVDPSATLLTADLDRVFVGCMVQAFGFPADGFRIGKSALHFSSNQLPLLRRVLRLSPDSSAEVKGILTKLLAAFNDYVDELSNLDSLLVQLRECEEDVRVCRDYVQAASDKCQQLIAADNKLSSTSSVLAERAAMGVVEEKFAVVSANYKAFVAAFKDDRDRRAAVQGVMTEYSKLEETYRTLAADHQKVASISSDLFAFAQAVVRQRQHLDGHLSGLLSSLRAASAGAQTASENGDKTAAAKCVFDAKRLLDDVYIEIDGVMECIANLTESNVRRESLKTESCPVIQRASESLLVYIGNVKTMITATGVSGGAAGVTVILGSGQERLDVNLKAFSSRMDMVGEAVALSTAKYAAAEQRYDEAFKALQDCGRVEQVRSMLDR